MQSKEAPEEGEKQNDLGFPSNPMTSHTTTGHPNEENSVTESSEMEDIDLNDEQDKISPTNNTSSHTQTSNTSHTSPTSPTSNTSPTLPISNTSQTSHTSPTSTTSSTSHTEYESTTHMSSPDGNQGGTTNTEQLFEAQRAEKEEKKKKELKKKELSKQRLTIPIALLELAPSPNIIEMFGLFHTQIHEMIIDKDVEPHPSLNGEWRLYRFLTGYGFNMGHASAAFEKHLNWLRSVYGDSTIRSYIMTEMLPTKSPENAPFHGKILEQFPMNMLLKDENGDLLLDNKGNILSIERPGFIDSKRFSGSINETELFMWTNYQLEFRSMLLDRLSRDRDALVQSTQIIDLSGISSRSLARMASHLWEKSIVLASQNYPEMLANIFFINTPKLFNTIWSMFKPLLTERTMNKIHILNENYEETLVKYINPESLPIFLGGKRSNIAASVPLTGMLSYDRYGLGFGRTELAVAPRKKEQLSYRVAPGMYIRWAWALESYDINFSIKISKHRSSTLFDKQETETVLASKTYDCSRTFKGTVYSPYDANIIFNWDNSWGLISPRHVHYRIMVSSPEDEDNA